MDVFDKAKELGELISQSDEMRRFNDDEALLRSDAAGMALMEDVERIRKEFIKASRDSAPEEILESLREEYINKQQEMQAYPVTADYLASKAGFDAFMEKVNNLIVFGMTGEAPCSDDKCASCKGGCKN